MSIVDVHNEWDPLEEIVVGRVFEDSRFPMRDAIFHGEGIARISPERRPRVPRGAIPTEVIRETCEDLDDLSRLLEGLGITVHRPDHMDFSKVCSTPFWEADGFHTYCPRDILLAIDDTIIETPVSFQSRQFESLAYASLMRRCVRAGSRWIAAPRVRLPDDALHIDENGEVALREDEPIFDAANVLRLGRDILYQVSRSGNRMGGQWLQNLLGPTYRIHFTYAYAGIHIDTTFVPLREGLVLVNGGRITEANLPEVFREWEVIYFKDVITDTYIGTPFGSRWLGINLLMANPHLAIIGSNQEALAATLQAHDIETIPCRLRHGRTLGGGIHCVTLDIRRRSG